MRNEIKHSMTDLLHFQLTQWRKIFVQDRQCYSQIQKIRTTMYEASCMSLLYGIGERMWSELERLSGRWR